MYFVCNQRADAGFTKPGQFTQQFAEFDSAAVVFNSATVEYSAAVALTGADQAAAAEYVFYLRATRLSNLSIRISGLFILRISNLSIRISRLSVLRISNLSVRILNFRIR